MLMSNSTIEKYLTLGEIKLFKWRFIYLCRGYYKIYYNIACNGI